MRHSKRARARLKAYQLKNKYMKVKDRNSPYSFIFGFDECFYSYLNAQLSPIYIVLSSNTCKRVWKNG